MRGRETSSASIVGNSFASLLGPASLYASPLLGALGSFFSGSNTISNLTFAGIQNTAALSLGLDRATILALQSAGGAMGNMICIHNIVAACAVVGLHREEGSVLRRMIIPLALYTLVLITIAAFLE